MPVTNPARRDAAKLAARPLPGCGSGSLLILYGVSGVSVSPFTPILEWLRKRADHGRRVGLGHGEAPGGEAIDQDPHPPPRGFDAFLPCRAAAVCPDPHLHGRDHPASPQDDRVLL